MKLFGFVDDDSNTIPVLGRMKHRHGHKHTNIRYSVRITVKQAHVQQTEH